MRIGVFPAALALLAALCIGRTASAEEASPDYDTRYGVVYAQRGEEKLAADLYLPRDAGPHPGVLVVHGGAWALGTRAQLAGVARRLAEEGFTAVAISYRLAPRHPFPAQIEDCRDAARWMRAHAKRLKLDPTRIGGFGYSAGGHLVALLGAIDAEDGKRIAALDDREGSRGGKSASRPESGAMPSRRAKDWTNKTSSNAAGGHVRQASPIPDEHAHPPRQAVQDLRHPSRGVRAWHPVAGSAAAEQPPSARLQCVVAGGAPCDFRALPEESRILAYWLGGSRAEKPDCYKLASPAHFVTQDDPPMFFFHGEEDALVPPSSPTAMAALLKTAGVPSRVYTVAEAGHLGAMRDQGALDEAVKFLKRRLQAERRGGIENCKLKHEN